MNSPRLLAAAILSLSTLPAQDILHYKFEAGCGNEVVNYAVGAFGNGTLTTTLPSTSSPWTGGRWGNAMAGTTTSGQTYVTTGWNLGAFTGSFSVSMWIRNNTGNASTIGFGYLFGATGSNFRCFTGSSGKLFVSGWGGSQNLVNANDLTTLLNAGFVHVALVVDSTKATATYYINGVADTPIALTGSVSFSGTDFSIGRYSTSTPSPLDFDEFLFTRRVLTAAEVQLLAQAPQAGAGRYGTGNAGTLVPSGGRPSFGNVLFQMAISDSASQSFLLFLGSNRCTIFGNVALPIDLGKVIPQFSGVNAYTDTNLARVVGALNAGGATLGLPVPNLPALAGYHLYWQAYTITSSNTLRGTNAVALGLGI
ncbi:MAG: LamG domain-containing protein [Planctomycetes bacterium]|nr:LamG domain-containing protein [Planctomycetota bacterium]MCB9871331.1 LamG domain-containing protein [Planctomycetota bacterium]